MVVQQLCLRALLQPEAGRPRVGHDSGLYHGTFLDLGPDGEVVVGDYCTLVGVIIATHGRVEIGDYTFIAHEVTIADHFCTVPPSVQNLAGHRSDGASTVIGPNVWIGARAILSGAVSIGEGAVIGVPPLSPVRFQLSALWQGILPG